MLVDKSALEQRTHSRSAARTISLLDAAGMLASCEMIALEVLYSARSAAERQKLWNMLSRFHWLNVTTGVMRRALEVQGLLTAKGRHRVSLPDLVIAATAELNRAIVLHYDKDYDLIAEVTGQPTEWVIPRGGLA